MPIKDWFRSQSYWLQGGILIEVFVFIIFLVLFALGDRLEISGGLFSLPAWAMLFFPGATLVEDIPKKFALVLVFTLFFYFFSGAILGLLFTLWKKFIKKQSVVFFHKVDWWYFCFLVLIVAILCTAYIINHPSFLAKEIDPSYLTTIETQDFNTAYIDDALGVTLRHPSSITPKHISGTIDGPKSVDFVTNDDKLVFKMETFASEFIPENGYYEFYDLDSPKKTYSLWQFIKEVQAGIPPERLEIYANQLEKLEIGDNVFFTYLWGYEEESRNKSLVGGRQFVAVIPHYGCTLEFRFSDYSPKIIKNILSFVELTPPEFDCPVQTSKEKPFKGFSFTPNETNREFTVYEDGEFVGMIWSDGPANAEFYKETETAVYINLAPDGLGGYILYTGAYNLWRLDKATKTIEKLNLEAGFVTDISLDEQYIAIASAGLESTKVIVKNIVDGSKREYFFDPKYQQIGDIKFSPDGKRIAVGVALGNPDNDGGAVYIVDLETGVKTLLKEIDGDYYTIKGWKNNEEVDIQ